MMPNTEHIAKIKAAFAEMETKEDLVNVLNLAKQSLYGDKSIRFTLRNLTYYADQRLAEHRYSVFLIPKKRGGSRTIHAPAPGLKAILRCLNYVLLCVYGDAYSGSATGFVPGRSIKDNAMRHAGKQYVYNIDLKDFFPSIDLRRVKAVFQLPPFNLNDEREPLAFLLANLCCHEMEVERQSEDGAWVKKRLSVLPQGAPTSPSITNFVAYRLDRRLKGAAKRYGATYTRYADDITFSSQHNLYNSNSEFLLEVRRIIAEQGFSINESKVRLQKPWYRQEVTGLVVNKHPNVPRKYVKQIRQWIYLWESYGYEKANLLFRRDYAVHTTNTVIPALERVLEGKLLYMKMIVGASNAGWLKLIERFNHLSTDRYIQSLDLEGLEGELDDLLGDIENDLFISEIDAIEEFTENTIHDEETDDE